MANSSPPKPVETATVESLLDEIGTRMADAEGVVELWVPNHVTLDGNPVAVDNAMEIVFDLVLANNYALGGISESTAGRLYRYVRAPSGGDNTETSFSLPLALVMLAALVVGLLVVFLR
jgi:hypothetical protein